MSDFLQPVALPRTDLVVGRIGIGPDYRIDADSYEEAFDRGMNYFYEGGTPIPSAYGEALRRALKRGREKVVVALQTYSRWGALARRSVERKLRRLGLDYADVLVLGWHNERPAQALLDAALELRERGRVRRFLMSCHNRPFFPEMAREGFFDLFMVRYNAVHRGAESEVFPKLPEGAARPGIVAYTATRWGNLIDPKKTPPGERTPRASDCYRFCLTNPNVSMVLAGPKNRAQMREALEALGRGPMSEEELAWMRRVGDHIHKMTRRGDGRSL